MERDHYYSMYVWRKCGVRSRLLRSMCAAQFTDPSRIELRTLHWSTRISHLRYTLLLRSARHFCFSPLSSRTRTLGFAQARLIPTGHGSPLSAMRVPHVHMYVLHMYEYSMYSGGTWSWRHRKRQSDPPRNAQEERKRNRVSPFLMG